MFSYWYTVTISAITAVSFLWVVSDTNKCQQGLGHTLLQQIVDLNIRRYKNFDLEDMVTYMQVRFCSHQRQSSIEGRLEGQLSLTTNLRQQS